MNACLISAKMERGAHLRADRAQELVLRVLHRSAGSVISSLTSISVCLDENTTVSAPMIASAIPPCAISQLDDLITDEIRPAEALSEEQWREEAVADECDCAKRSDERCWGDCSCQ